MSTVLNFLGVIFVLFFVVLGASCIWLEIHNNFKNFDNESKNNSKKHCEENCK